jgi:hypothetical protein
VEDTIPDDLPPNEYYEYFKPDYKLHLTVSRGPLHYCQLGCRPSDGSNGRPPGRASAPSHPRARRRARAGPHSLPAPPHGRPAPPPAAPASAQPDAALKNRNDQAALSKVLRRVLDNLRHVTPVSAGAEPAAGAAAAAQLAKVAAAAEQQQRQLRSGGGDARNGDQGGGAAADGMVVDG